MACYQRHSSQADYYAYEHERTSPGQERDYCHSEAGQYHLRWNAARFEEIQQRNAEITNHLFSIYCSYKVAGILIADVMMSLLLFPWQYFAVGLVGSNFLVFVVVLFYCNAAAKTTVRPELRPGHSAIAKPVNEKALRR